MVGKIVCRCREILWHGNALHVYTTHSTRNSTLNCRTPFLITCSLRCHRATEQPNIRTSEWHRMETENDELCMKVTALYWTSNTQNNNHQTDCKFISIEQLFPNFFPAKSSLSQLPIIIAIQHLFFHAYTSRSAVCWWLFSFSFYLLIHLGP